MFKPVKIPRGVANIFSIGNAKVSKIGQNYEHRTDKILDTIGAPSFEDECVNNWLSNLSPISAVNGKSYTTADSLFKGYFKA